MGLARHCVEQALLNQHIFQLLEAVPAVKVEPEVHVACCAFHLLPEDVGQDDVTSHGAAHEEWNFQCIGSVARLFQDRAQCMVYVAVRKSFQHRRCLFSVGLPPRGCGHPGWS